MCGISGHINFHNQVNYENIQAMNNAIRHRGPDGEGVFISDDSVVALGHRRLSFLDLSNAGKQPMQSGQNQCTITYNGEIYNYIELRHELEQYGYKFISHTDTEVLLHSYDKWGINMLEKLKGMFAFGIWDEKKQELFLARDRFGIKPLYYYHQKNDFIFASEIKAIKANSVVQTTLDYSSLADFFVYRYIPSPKSIWREVKKLPAAHYLIYNKKNETVSINEYWKLLSDNTSISDSSAIEKFDQLLYNSVKTHARSDVPVGSFLSGGYDSSAIVYYMSRFGYVPHTFSIGFEGWDVSEHLFAEMVSKQFGTKHTSLILPSQSLDTLDHLSWIYDEPLGDISIIPTFLISKEASKQVKAVMSGEGSDELLVGYQWQKEYEPRALSLSQKLLRLVGTNSKSYLLEYYAQWMSMGRFDGAELKKLLHPDLHSHLPQNAEWFYHSLYNASLPDLKAMQMLDIKHFMGELVLTKVDRASMANSLEVRVPFLDHEIAEFVFNLNSEVYYRKNETKHLLYQNIKNHLPEVILNRKKQGFVGPDIYYMNIKWYEARLNDSRLIKDKVVNHEYVEQLLGNKDHWRLWKLAVMDAWYNRWM